MTVWTKCPLDAHIAICRTAEWFDRNKILRLAVGFALTVCLIFITIFAAQIQTVKAGQLQTCETQENETCLHSLYCPGNLQCKKRILQFQNKRVVLRRSSCRPSHIKCIAVDQEQGILARRESFLVSWGITFEIDGDVLQVNSYPRPPSHRKSLQKSCQHNLSMINFDQWLWGILISIQILLQAATQCRQRYMEAQGKIVITLDRSRRRTRARASNEPSDSGRAASRLTNISKGTEKNAVRAFVCPSDI